MNEDIASDYQEDELTEFMVDELKPDPEWILTKEKLDESIKAQAHSDLIKDTIQTYGLDIDVVVEAKHKELAVLNYKN